MPTSSSAFTWVGRAATGLVALLMIASLAVKLLKTKDFVDQFVVRLEWPSEMIFLVAMIEACCLALYLIPQTAILGAILLTAFLGGATASHLRVHENVAQPVVVGVLVWVGIFFREPQLRALLPIRRATTSTAAKS